MNDVGVDAVYRLHAFDLDLFGRWHLLAAAHRLVHQVNLGILKHM
jgi:hypothetical protein